MKVLIIKINSVGDAVMALPMLETIRALDENAKITWVCGTPVAPLLKAFSSIDELITVDESKLCGASGSLPAVFEVVKVCARLAGRSYDLVVTGHRDSRYRLLSCTVRAAERRRWSWGWPVPGRYHADECVRLITGADGPDTKPAGLPTLRLPLSQSLQAALRATRAPLLALAPGGARNALRDQPLKRWPLQSYVELSKRAVELGWSVVITGALSDKWISSAFRELSVVDLIGRTSIVDLVAVYNRCNAILTHDSGPMHLAALAGAPLVALFGPTDPAWFAPRGNYTKVLWGGSDLVCRPCYNGRSYARCVDNRCMQNISVEMVVEALKKLMPLCRHRTLPVEGVVKNYTEQV
jgi:ADP-heptose:LPS heptosyltransferase